MKNLLPSVFVVIHRIYHSHHFTKSYLHVASSHLCFAISSAQKTKSADQSLRCNVAHGCQHRNPAVLQLSLTTSLEVLHAAIRCEPSRIPKPNWRLHAQLVLKGSQRRSGVVGPISPGASGQAILHVNTQALKHYRSAASRIHNTHNSEFLAVLKKSENYVLNFKVVLTTSCLKCTARDGPGRTFR